MTFFLDKIDKRILFELDKNARITETKLAKLVKKSKESVRYRIKKLQERGIIQQFTIWIDPTKLGYRTAKIYLQLANKPEQREQFIEFVRNDPRLFWLGIAQGAWNAGITYFVKNTAEFFELKNELFSKFKSLILESHTGMLVDVHVCEKAFLHNTEPKWKTLFVCENNLNLDDTEKKICRILFENGRENIASIARKVNTSVDIVRARVKKLQKEGIIFRYVATIDYSKIGYEFFKTFLYFRSLDTREEQRLFEFTRSHPNIIHFIRQISPWDIELEIMCTGYSEYNSIIDQITTEFSTSIVKVETAIMGQDYVFSVNGPILE